MPEQSVGFLYVDLLPAYENNDRKALNNPIEAHIIAEVKMPSLLSLRPRGFTALFFQKCMLAQLLANIHVCNAILMYLL